MVSSVMVSVGLIFSGRCGSLIVRDGCIKFTISGHEANNCNHNSFDLQQGDGGHHGSFSGRSSHPQASTDPVTPREIM